MGWISCSQQGCWPEQPGSVGLKGPCTEALINNLSVSSGLHFVTIQRWSCTACYTHESLGAVRLHIEVHHHMRFRAEPGVRQELGRGQGRRLDGSPRRWGCSRFHGFRCRVGLALSKGHQAQRHCKLLSGQPASLCWLCHLHPVPYLQASALVSFSWLPGSLMEPCSEALLSMRVTRLSMPKFSLVSCCPSPAFCLHHLFCCKSAQPAT